MQFESCFVQIQKHEYYFTLKLNPQRGFTGWLVLVHVFIYER